MRNVMETPRIDAGLRGSLRVAGAALLLVTVATDSSAQSILAGNFLPNPDMETETRFVGHRTEGPTDNSFADYWHHSQFSGWNDLTPPNGEPPEPVLSGIHSLRLFDQEEYYFSPESPAPGCLPKRSFAPSPPKSLRIPTLPPAVPRNCGFAGTGTTTWCSDLILR